MSNTIDTSALLTQLRTMARQAGVPAPSVPAAGVPFARPASAGAAAPVGGVSGDGQRAAGVDFTELLRHSIEGVNERSRTARVLTESFESGNPDVQLADVMIAVQKARVSFEAMTQVRNKMVAAYKDIMSTPL